MAPVLRPPRVSARLTGSFIPVMTSVKPRRTAIWPSRMKLTTVDELTPVTCRKSMIRKRTSSLRRSSDGLAKPVGRAEEDEALEPDDQDGVAVPAEVFAALLRHLERALIVLSGEHVPDAVDAPVLDDEEDDRRDEPDEDAGGEADADDDQEDQDDDQVLPERQAARGQHQPLVGHRRADPDEQAAEKRRRNEVEDKFAEKRTQPATTATMRPTSRLAAPRRAESRLSDTAG